jgi:dUTP pyrophosphatase
MIPDPFELPEDPGWDTLTWTYKSPLKVNMIINNSVSTEMAAWDKDGRLVRIHLNPLVKIKKLTATATVPEYKTAGAAGMDLCADLPGDDEAHVYPGHLQLIPTGLSLAIPEGFEGQIRPRSGLALKQSLTVLNSPGTLDSDYRGPVGIILYNAGSETRIIKHGDRIAQLVICPVATATLEVVEDLDSTDRGSGGFGSTGV